MEENVRPTVSQLSQQHPGQPPGSSLNAISTSYHIPPGQQPSSVQALAMQAVDGNMWNDVGSIRSCSTSMRYRPPPPPPPKKPLKKRIKDAIRAFVAFVFSKVGICVLVIGYLFVGAAMFQQLEEPEEQKIRFQMSDTRSSVVHRLWKITEQYNTLHPANWTLEVTRVIEDYQARVIHEKLEKGYDGSDIPARKWTFTGALLYSITVITTIGYGHIAPVTPVGKLVTIFYAIVGIPVFLLYLSNIGDIMAKSFKWTYSRLCKCQRGPKPASEQMPSGILKKPQDTYRIQYIPQHVHGLNNQATSQQQPPPPNLPPEESTSSMASGPVGSEEYSDDLYATRVYNKPSKPTVNLEDVTVPISLCLLVMVSYILGGAMLFSEWEGWGYLEGFYFSFITLSTIGFGDMVPGDSISDTPGEASDPFNTKFVLCSLYILVGMALIAMCFNLMQEKVVKGVRSLGKRIASYKKKKAGNSDVAES